MKTAAVLRVKIVPTGIVLFVIHCLIVGAIQEIMSLTLISLLPLGLGCLLLKFSPKGSKLLATTILLSSSGVLLLQCYFSFLWICFVGPRVPGGDQPDGLEAGFSLLGLNLLNYIFTFFIAVFWWIMFSVERRKSKGLFSD